MLTRRNFHVPRDVASCALSMEIFQAQRPQAHSALLELHSTNDQRGVGHCLLNTDRRPTVQPPRYHCLCH